MANQVLARADDGTARAVRVDGAIITWLMPGFRVEFADADLPAETFGTWSEAASAVVAARQAAAEARRATRR